MKITFKKISGFFLILLGLAPMLLFLVINLKQQSIRMQMKHKMEIQSLHSITLADNEIHWAKEGKEIWVDGKMFDIKSMTHRNGTTTFYGLFDEEETNLNKWLSEDWGKKSAGQNQLLAQLFQSMYTIELYPSPDFISLTDRSRQNVIVSSSKLQSQFKTILTPPPQA